jgi:NADH-quinone oxidoreductase subunit G
MPTLIVDGKEVTVPPGKNLIQASGAAGSSVPHYCFHPSLKIVASCRICFVEVTQEVRGKSRTGLLPACNTMAADGMVVSTDSEAVKKAQADVMEFLLINHPVDCPVCDQAGECNLQNYAYKYGHGYSRMSEPKRFKPAKKLGSGIRLFTNRCILCDRCVRFLRDYVGTGELTIRNMGNANEIDIMPGHPIDNPMATNIVDLCPVGALLTEDALFKARSWNLKRKKSIDPSDSLGANIFLDVNNNEVQRARSRPNMKVNSYFVSDEGRFMYHAIRSEDRLANPVQPEPGTDALLDAPWEPALAFVDEKMRGASSSAVVLVSTHATQQEVEAANEYAAEIGAGNVSYIPNALVTEDQTFPGGFTIKGEKSPNTTGVTSLVEKSLDDVEINSSSVVLVINSSVRTENISEAHLDKISGADFVFAIDVLKSPLVKRSFLSLAGRMWAEKQGTWVNFENTEQSFEPAVVGPMQSRNERDILLDLTQRAKLGARQTEAAGAAS